MPRARLLAAPTPVERLERFEKAIGSKHPIFIKRDDAIPFGFGGNKFRKLELVMAQALAEGATSVITCGGIQSNHCRATAAAATRLGLGCHLVLSGAPPQNLTGNTRLDEIFGAAIHFVPTRQDRAPRMVEIETSLREHGERPFPIPLGASTPLGGAGLALALFEIIDQGHRPEVIVHASSSGGTQAGLIAGAAMAGLETRIVGVSADEPKATLELMVEDLARGVLALVQSDAMARKAEVWDEFVGAGYGIPTEASKEALCLDKSSELLVIPKVRLSSGLFGA